MSAGVECNKHPFVALKKKQQQKHLCTDKNIFKRNVKAFRYHTIIAGWFIQFVPVKFFLQTTERTLTHMLIISISRLSYARPLIRIRIFFIKKKSSINSILQFVHFLKHFYNWSNNEMLFWLILLKRCEHLLFSKLFLSKRISLLQFHKNEPFCEKTYTLIYVLSHEFILTCHLLQEWK